MELLEKKHGWTLIRAWALNRDNTVHALFYADFRNCGCDCSCSSFYIHTNLPLISIQPMMKKWKNIRWKKWHYPSSAEKKYRPPSEQDIDELIKKLGTSVRPTAEKKDVRACALCGGFGDGETNGPAR